MGLTVTLGKQQRTCIGRLAIVRGTIAFDTAYLTGGEALTAANLHLKTVDAFLAEPKGAYAYLYDHANSKLKVISATGAGLKTFTGADIKGSANTESPNTDQAACATNGEAVAAMATTATTWTHGALTNPDMGRNVCITVENTTGGALDLYEGAMKFTVTGTWRGIAQTEDITLTSTAGNKSVAANQFRYTYGSKPFDTVTNIVLDNVPADGIACGAGLGSKIGLPTNLLTPAAADVVDAIVNAAHYTLTDKVDATNMTVNVGAISDGADFTFMYYDSPEVENGTDLSTICASVPFVAFGNAY